MFPIHHGFSYRVLYREVLAATTRFFLLTKQRSHTIVPIFICHPVPTSTPASHGSGKSRGKRTQQSVLIIGEITLAREVRLRTSATCRQSSYYSRPTLGVDLLIC